jgi:hypothetical protein
MVYVANNQGLSSKYTVLLYTFSRSNSGSMCSTQQYSTCIPTASVVNTFTPTTSAGDDAQEYTVY